MILKYKTFQVIGGILMIAILSACSKTAKTPFVAYDNLAKSPPIKPPEKPVRIVTLPKPLPLPGQLKKKPKKHKDSDQKTGEALSLKQRIQQAKNKAAIEPADNGYINAMQVYPYTKGALYKLYAAVNQVSDIALQPGENLLSVSAGDAVRWVVGDSKSGRGDHPQVHVQVKPVAPDLQTNLIIHTDRRTYHLELVSDLETYMASVSWTYPHDDLITLKRKSALANQQSASTVHEGISLKKLNFRYRIKGDAPWKPVRVFDDGHKVYIQFPSGIIQGEAPPLFIIGYKSKLTLVNYRMKHPYYIVDRLFAAAELRHGETPQTRVRIIRQDAVWKTETGS